MSIFRVESGPVGDELLRKLAIIFRTQEMLLALISWGAVSCIVEYLINKDDLESIPDITPSEL